MNGTIPAWVKWCTFLELLLGAVLVLYLALVDLTYVHGLTGSSISSRLDSLQSLFIWEGGAWLILTILLMAAFSSRKKKGLQNFMERPVSLLTVAILVLAFLYITLPVLLLFSRG